MPNYAAGIEPCQEILKQSVEELKEYRWQGEARIAVGLRCKSQGLMEAGSRARIQTKEFATCSRGACPAIQPEMVERESSANIVYS